MLVAVRVDEPKIVFHPVLNDCRDIIHACFTEIIDGAKGLPRVSVQRRCSACEEWIERIHIWKSYVYRVAE